MTPGVPTEDINSTFGALQIGALFAVYLFGIVTLQCHVYYTHFREDRRLFKVLVALIWFLELGHTIAICYEIYTATITYYGFPEKYSHYPGFGVATLLGGTITMLVQIFFAMRVFTVLPNPWRHIGIFCAVLTSLRCIVSVYAGVEGARASSLAEYTHKFRAMLATLLITGAMIDIVIAISMMWFLVHQREQAFERVARLIDRLVAYTIRTGLVTSVAAVAIIIVFSALPDTLIWLALYSFLAKLYSNSLLSALNARRNLREGVAPGDSLGLSKTRYRNVIPPGGGLNLNNAISIEMKTTTQKTVDGPGCYAVRINTPMSFSSYPSSNAQVPLTPDSIKDDATGDSPLAELPRNPTRVHHAI